MSTAYACTSPMSISGISASSTTWIKKPKWTIARGIVDWQEYSIVRASGLNPRTSTPTSSHSPAGSFTTYPLWVISAGFPLKLRTAEGTLTSSGFSQRPMTLKSPACRSFFSVPLNLLPKLRFGSVAGPPGRPAGLAKNCRSVRTPEDGQPLLALRKVSGRMWKKQTKLHPSSVAQGLSGFAYGSFKLTQITRGRPVSADQRAFPSHGSAGNADNGTSLLTISSMRVLALSASQHTQSYKMPCDFILRPVCM
mmetsp:Transcript_64610/g.179703  ORF Transcript_64610/g.179703 Transcript_64610/m.179703 type:complete len:252 (+) Transcript_64610:108-863(+)